MLTGPELEALKASDDPNDYEDAARKVDESAAFRQHFLLALRSDLRTGHPKLLAALQSMIEGFADNAIQDYALPVARGSLARIGKCSS